jgi:hypothetical protein
MGGLTSLLLLVVSFVLCTKLIEVHHLNRLPGAIGVLIFLVHSEDNASSMGFY